MARIRALSPVGVCLLTDAGGVLRSPASDVWAGAREAAAARKVRVTSLAVPTPRSAASMLNSLIAQKCTVIAAVGTDQVKAVQAAAHSHPSVRFAVAGAPAAAAGVVAFAATRLAAADAIGQLIDATGGQS